MVKSEKDLFRKIDFREEFLVRHLHQKLEESIPESAKLVLPLSIGNHVDHQLTRLAGEGVISRCCYYAEYPYVINPQFEVDRYIKKAWKKVFYSVSEESLLSWQQAVSEYQSQISTFWTDVPAMYAAIHSYWVKGGGEMLWCEE